MKESILLRSNKDLIMEAIYDEVTYETFRKVRNAENVYSLKDLEPVLDSETYDFVKKCVNKYFGLQAARLCIKYHAAIGDPLYTTDDGFIIE